MGMHFQGRHVGVAELRVVCMLVLVGVRRSRLDRLLMPANATEDP